MCVRERGDSALFIAPFQFQTVSHKGKLNTSSDGNTGKKKEFYEPRLNLFSIILVKDSFSQDVRSDLLLPGRKRKFSEKHSSRSTRCFVVLGSKPVLPKRSWEVGIGIGIYR